MKIYCSEKMRKHDNPLVHLKKLKHTQVNKIRLKRSSN